MIDEKKVIKKLQDRIDDIHQGVNSGLCMAIHFTKEKKESKM